MKKNILALLLAVLMISGLVVGGVFLYKAISNSSQAGSSTIQPEQPDDEYTTEIKDFKFEGNKIVDYTGNASQLTLPTSYSIGKVDVVKFNYGSIESLQEGLNDVVQDSAYPVTITDANGKTYSVNSPALIPFIMRSAAFPVSFEQKTIHFCEGNDYKLEIVGMSLFSHNETLQSVIIPEGYTTIQSSAFQSCSMLESVQLPNSIKDFGYGIFFGASKLKTIKGLENTSITKILDNTFRDTALSEIHMPDTVEQIGSYAFFGTNISTIRMPKNLTDFKFYKLENLRVVEGLENTNVTVIPSQAFYGCSNLTSIKLPENLTEIGSSAFASCSSLELLDLPDSVQKIGETAFQLTSIKKIHFPIALIEFNSAFKKMGELLEVEGMENSSISRIADSAFDSDVKLARIALPGTLTGIGSYAFNNCSTIDNLDLSKIQSLGNYAFTKCSSLQTVDLGSSDYLIGEHIFEDCTSLREVKLSENEDVHIPDFSFRNCKNLTTINLKNAKAIGASAFQNCDGISDLNINYGCMIMSSSFENCTSLTSVYIGENCQVYEKAFRGCTNLSKLTISMGIGISEKGFENCTSLKVIDYEGPKLVSGWNGSSIDKTAFLNCDLEKLIIRSEQIIQTMLKYNGSQAFENFDNLKIYVPDNYVEKIKDFSSDEPDNVFWTENMKSRVQPISALGE